MESRPGGGRGHRVPGHDVWGPLGDRPGQLGQEVRGSLREGVQVAVRRDRVGGLALCVQVLGGLDHHGFQPYRRTPRPSAQSGGQSYAVSAQQHEQHPHLPGLQRRRSRDKDARHGVIHQHQVRRRRRGGKSVHVHDAARLHRGRRGLFTASGSSDATVPLVHLQQDAPELTLGAPFLNDNHVGASSPHGGRGLTPDFSSTRGPADSPRGEHAA